MQGEDQQPAGGRADDQPPDVVVEVIEVFRLMEFILAIAWLESTSLDMALHSEL